MWKIFSGEIGLNGKVLASFLQLKLVFEFVEEI